MTTRDRYIGQSVYGRCYRDMRWTYEREYAGHVKPVWVLRHCGEWVFSAPTRAALLQMSDAEYPLARPVRTKAQLEQVQP